LAADPAIRTIFGASLHWTFWGVAVVAVLTFLSAWLIPVGREQGRASVTSAASEASH
jgi:hypothetical protein